MPIKSTNQYAKIKYKSIEYFCEHKHFGVDICKFILFQNSKLELKSKFSKPFAISNAEFKKSQKPLVERNDFYGFIAFYLFSCRLF